MVEAQQAEYGPDSAEGRVPGIQPPARRPLKIFAFDPSLGRAVGNLAVIDIVNEKLEVGPQGRLVRVVDYDASRDLYYAPVDLDEPSILIQRGLDPSESDPRFHQQMVYAVVMKVIENFERALGRPFRFAGEEQLTVLPHAFDGENAYYDPDTKSLQFGYFTADAIDPGPNLPGQTVFSCLSHDIIAHETTHAIVDRLRDLFNAPTNRDVLAFHEGIADIVAIFQHFSFPDVLRNELSATRAELAQPGRLLELARQFGYATGSGQALRTALDAGPDRAPDRTLYQTALEPHERGSILVAAVFDAFFRIYKRRIRDIVRAATGGSGVLPAGELQFDLLTLITTEAAEAAQDVLTMCLRAFEYVPPVDITFGDYLRGLITADFELNPRDEFDRRTAFIDAFRARGVYAPGTTSLAEEALRLDRPAELENATISPGLVQQVLASQFAFVAEGERKWPSEPPYAELSRFAKNHASSLRLDPRVPIEVKGFHPSFHVGENGQLLVELVAQWTQTYPKGDDRREEIGGVVLRAGTTAVFASDGTVRYIAARPLPGPHLQYASHKDLAMRRISEFRSYVDALDAQDPVTLWCSQADLDRRMAGRATSAAAHRVLPTWGH
jgi:hypothetical protein